MSKRIYWFVCVVLFAANLGALWIMVALYQ